MVEDRDENDVFEQTEEKTSVTSQGGVSERQTSDGDNDGDNDGDGEENPTGQTRESGDSDGPIAVAPMDRPEDGAKQDTRAGEAESAKESTEGEPEELDSADVEELDAASLKKDPPSSPVPPPPEKKERKTASPPSPPVPENDAITPTAPPPLPAELEGKKPSSAKAAAGVGAGDSSGHSPEKNGRDRGTPDAVFDAVSVKDAEDAEEIDLDGAEDITDRGLFNFEEGPAAFKSPKMRRRHKRPSEWWAEIFDDDYLSILPTPTSRDDRREVDFIEKNLSVKKGSLILDLACGNGRHAVGMARRGYRVVGVDLSLPMLARAGELAQENDQKINFIHGDMRELGFDKTFDAIYCVGTSMGYFDDSTNIKVLEGIAQALKPGSPFLLEVSNRDHIIEKQPNLTWFEGSGAVCMEETSFNYINSRLCVTRQLIFGNSGRQVNHELSVRLYSLHELGLILSRAGFIVHHVAGHHATPGAFFGTDSSKIIILAVRPK
jgi:SAM-dependent methyltransferase